MNSKSLGIWLSLLLICSMSALGAQFIDSEQRVVHQQLSFKPKFKLTVSEKITEAINNGITITFVVQANLNQSVDWWFDQSISKRISTFKLHYYSMSRLYQLHNINQESRQNFVSLDLLFKQLSEETEFIFDLKKGGDYIETRIFLDKQALPSTMQLPTVFDQDWNINSDWQIVKLAQPAATNNE